MEVGRKDHASGRHPRMRFFQPHAESDVISAGKEKDWIQEDLVHPHHEEEDEIALPSSHLVDDPKQRACHFLDDPFVLSMNHVVAAGEAEVDSSPEGVEDTHAIGEVEDPKMDHHMASTGHRGVHKA